MEFNTLLYLLPLTVMTNMKQDALMGRVTYNYNQRYFLTATPAEMVIRHLDKKTQELISLHWDGMGI
jgi:hypothetical protein